MPRRPVFVVDAFTAEPFAGNPAAVCPIDSHEPWPDEARMQAIAAEMNLSETAFVREDAEGWHIRWFTPACEVDLCGHATLASAAVILEALQPNLEGLTLMSASGPLHISRAEDRFVLDFPRNEATPWNEPAVAAALGVQPEAVLKSHEAIAVLPDAAAVRAAAPDLAAVAALDADGLVVTAPGDGEGCDFVSRYFAPHVGIDEDPVTGAVHCTLAPYWGKRLGRPRMHARQLSRRGGVLWVEDTGTRVKLEGNAVLVMRGELLVS